MTILVELVDPPAVLRIDMTGPAGPAGADGVDGVAAADAPLHYDAGTHTISVTPGSDGQVLTTVTGVPTWAAGGGGLTDEDVRDIIGTALTAGTGIAVTVNDPGDTITVAVSGLTAGDVGADPAGTAASAVAAHSADTTGVHGIADTAALVLTSDSRLSDARTPLAHVHSGSDITTGTVATARLNVGTTAGTVAAGDDSRFTVGGQRNRGYGSATWVGSSAASGATTSSANGMDLHTVGSASCWPVWLAAGGYDRIAVYVSTGGTATLRLGLSYSAADGGVGPPAWDAGTISVSSTGRVEISGSVTLPEGWYWTVVMCESYTAAFSLYARSWTQNDIRNGIALESTSFRQYGSVRHAGIPTGSLPDLSSYPVYGSLYGPIVALRRA